MNKKNHKIVFTGPPGSGKTTAIASISDEAPIVTDVRNTDSSLHKEKTTVGMDFGQIRIDDNEYVNLFGTPGQLRFNFMWPVLAKNALGLIILLDARKENTLKELSLYLENFASVLPNLACSIGVGWTDKDPKFTLDDYSEHLSQCGLLLPVMAVDVRERNDVLSLIDSVLAQVHARQQ